MNAHKQLEIRDKCILAIRDLPLELMVEVWQAIQQIKALGRKDIPPIPANRKIQ